MKTSAPPPLTLAQAFAQFLESSPFARRTRESYTEDLAPLLAEVGQQSATALTDVDLQAFLARQEALAPATYNRRLAAIRSFTRWLRDQGWQAAGDLLITCFTPMGNPNWPRGLSTVRPSPTLVLSKSAA